MRAFSGWTILGVGSAGVLAAMALTSAPGRAQATSPEDARNVAQLLDGMRGVGPLPCALALGVIEGNGWGNWPGGAGAGEDTAVSRLRHWLNEGISDPSVVPGLRSAMQPGDECVRQTAARLLGRIDHPRAVTALAEAVRDPDATTRMLGALGLGISDVPGAYEPLVGAVRDADARVRAAAATALGRLGDHRASSALLPLLNGDRSPEVRRAAAYALGALD